jgi:hypothetical protein
MSNVSTGPARKILATDSFYNSSHQCWKPPPFSF